MKNIETDSYLDNIIGIIDMWESKDISSREKLEGLTHSIFLTIEGCVEGVPKFKMKMADDLAQRFIDKKKTTKICK